MPTKFSGSIGITEPTVHLGDTVTFRWSILPAGTIPWAYMRVVDAAGTDIGHVWTRLDLYPHAYIGVSPSAASTGAVPTKVVVDLLVWNPKTQDFYKPVATAELPIT